LVLVAVLGFALSGCAVRQEIQGGFYPPAAPSAAEGKRLANVRVALNLHAEQIQVNCSGPVQVFDMHARAQIAEVALSADALLLTRGPNLVLDRQSLSTDHIRLVPPNNVFLKVNGLRYRGQIDCALQRNTIRVINYVALEDYLRGVVPNEVTHSWPLEALKAQAVAARTFALYRMSTQADSDYDLDDGTNSQVYRGLDSEQEGTNRAVQETRQLAAVYQGKFISAFYHANCGGHTADVKHVWGGDIRYLSGTACGFCEDGPHYRWKFQIGKTDLAKVLSKHNFPVRDVKGLDLVGRLPDSRILSVEIVTRDGRESLKAAEFRMLVGADKIRSTNFEVADQGALLVFTGKGWGHGAGLCQEGACGMARSGYGFREILEHYYPGIEITSLGQ
jgi:stage II sporulation protein D